MTRTDIPHPHAPRPTPRRRFHGQRGTALVVSLIILLVMTVLGIGALGTSALEGKAAYNNQEWNEAFQAAESAIRDGRTNATIMAQAITQGVGAPPTSYTPPLPPSPPGPARYAANTTMRFNGQGSAFGSSMGKLIAYNFDVRGQGWAGVDPARRSFAANLEGVQRVGPGGS
jgi:hypothetical protein